MSGTVITLDDVVVGRPMTFRLWPILARTIHADARVNTLQRCVVVFGKWLVPTSRSWEMAE